MKSYGKEKYKVQYSCKYSFDRIIIKKNLKIQSQKIVLQTKNSRR